VELREDLRKIRNDLQIDHISHRSNLHFQTQEFFSQFAKIRWKLFHNRIPQLRLICLFKAKTSFNSAEPSSTSCPKCVEIRMTWSCDISMMGLCWFSFSFKHYNSCAWIRIFYFDNFTEFPCVKFVSEVLSAFPSNAKINSRKMKRGTRDSTW
jgi:hypothetical protein